MKNLPILQSIVHFGAALVLGALASCAPMQPTEGPSSTTYIAPNKAFVASEVASSNQKVVKVNSFISSASEQPMDTASAASDAVAEQAPTNTPADASLGVTSTATNTSGNNESSEPTIGGVNNQNNNSTSNGPTIAQERPKDVLMQADYNPVVSAEYASVGSSIDVSQIRLWINDADVTSQAEITANKIFYQQNKPWAEGVYKAKLSVTDVLGRTAMKEWQFGLAYTPQISQTSPKDVQLAAGVKPTISASFTAKGKYQVDLKNIQLIVNNEDVTSKAIISNSGISYTPSTGLEPGYQGVFLLVGNSQGALDSQAWSFEVLPKTIYSVEFTNPSGPQSVTDPLINPQITVRSNVSNPVQVILNGQTLDYSADQPSGNQEADAWGYAGELKLINGTNTLRAKVTFADGHVEEATTQITYNGPARITITSPVDKAIMGPLAGANFKQSQVSGGSVNLSGNVERPVTITGRSDKPLQSVMINQQAAKITEGGLGFVFNNFYLREGNNMLSAVGTDAQGRKTSTSILVNIDQTAPLLSIESPQDQSLISRSKIDIRGTVNDAVEGLFQAPQPTLSVQVNGKAIEAATQVTDKQFLIKDLPLQTGPNRIVITASDMHGNQRSASILVLRNFIGSSRITLLSGDQQSGLIGEKLTQPLRVVALDENGSPLAKQAINVDVIRGSGSISDSASQEHKANGLTLSRNLKLITDNNGELQVWHRLGTQAGPAVNAIRFSHPSIPEEAIFTATSQPGPVAILNGDMGLFQNVQTQSQPLELLTAVVRDKALNPLSGVAVEFFVKSGQAYFAPEEGVMIADMNGKTGQKITLKTDKNGLVAVRPYIGEEEGLVEIQAKLATIATIGGSATNTATPVLADVIYKLQAKAAKDGPTGFSGRVFDDKGLPIAGVTLSIARTVNSTTTDAKGQFNFNDIPAGRIDLFVDGRTVNPNLDSAKPQYPSLHFEAYAVQGQANSLTHPIYMPPLLITPQSAKLVGAQDTTLTLPNLAGFSMFIKKGSVTFPDGSKTGQLIVSPVTADRLPMSPPSGGALFGLPAWTIQPAGTRFDPPIEVRMPNNTALPPGSRTPVIQWDHDLGQYTAMGYATVSEDGSQLITEAGSGISKAGWGGACVYTPGATGVSGPVGPPLPCPPLPPTPPTVCDVCQNFELGTGICPRGECVKDPSKDTKVVGEILTSEYQIEHTVKNAILKKINNLFKKYLKNAPVTAGFKWKGKVGVKQYTACCSVIPEGRAVVRGFLGAAEGELELKWTPSKTILSLAETIFQDFGDAEMELLAVSGKAFAGFTIDAKVTKCDTGPRVVGNFAKGGTLEGVLVSFKFPAPKPAEGNSPEVKAEIEINAKSGVKYATGDELNYYGNSSFRYKEKKGNGYFYIKGDLKAFDRTATLINYSVPLGDSNGTGTLDL